MRAFKILAPRCTYSRHITRSRSTEQTEHVVKSEKLSGRTVNIEDVEHHSKLSDKWWDKYGEMRPLHSFNPLRIQFVRDGLANTGFAEVNPCLPLHGAKILDVGCGGGILSEPLARIGAYVTGIDASSELITTAKQHALQDPDLSGRLNYMHVTVEELSQKHPEYYDAVVASEVLEHVQDKPLFLKCCASALRPGGSLFITTLNRTLPSWLGGIIMAENILKLIPKGTHDWNKFISPSETQRLLEDCDCKTKLIHGMFYNPLKNEWYWTESTAMSYAIQAVKRTDN